MYITAVQENNTLQSEIMELKRRLLFYENSNSPPSADSLLCKQLREEKQQTQKIDSDNTKRGAKKGHIGVSHKRKPAKVILYDVQYCSKCKSKNISKTNSISKIITDIPQMPQAQIIQYIISNYKYNRCNHITT